ncbi:yecA family protein [Gemmobacter caeni]|uniref:YecA family protein n=1 Tax=Gemmobacter caeni TaxID=589035 RepID=A0A2T6ABZ6_9RHOB|nr:UPF0149 family protein [Gemmobacter caeni]PTX41317.1 yecA family protein [Gemmobacter caeni]TWI89978.1 yecA family protein [Gemmobacter caeni]
MAKGRIDAALAALAQAGGDGFGARRDILERFSFDLLHRPALGGQIVARLCAIDDPSPKDEDLLDLLGAGLDAARIACENGKARGQAFLAAVEDALALARRQGRMTPSHNLILAQLWTRNGLPAPVALELQREDVVAGVGRRTANPAEGDALLDGLFAELIQQAEGEPLALHHALTESFPAMPPEMRAHVVAYSVGRSDALHADLACFWLLDPAPPIRLAAAQGLADRLAQGTLPGRILATLVVLRSWMPEDAARGRVDQVLKEAMRKGVVADPDRTPWMIHGIRATLPDGGGAQSIGIALQSGTHRKMAMLLLKQGQGVKDAYTIPCANAREQKSITERMSEDVGALSVTVECLHRALSVALADGLAQGRPPVPGLIEIARICGLTALRPEVKSTPELIAGLGSSATVKALSQRQQGALIMASDEWWDRHEIIESWFEDSDEAHAVLDKARSARSAEAALWKWLETRRDWWARIMARAADVLETGLHPDAAGFVACATALLEGRELKKIPVMLDIHEQTIEAWIRDDPDFDPEASLEDLAEAAPEPEKKGEVATLLRGTGLSSDWLDGYLTGIVIAPKVIMPNQWLPRILDAVLPRIDPSRFQRFMDLLMMRAQAVAEIASEPTDLAASIYSRSKKGQGDWASGFSEALDRFRSAWPKKGMTKEDRRLIEIGAAGVAGVDLSELAALIAERQAKNSG